MKKKLVLLFIAIILIIILIFLILYFNQDISYHYDPEKAIEYSYKYVEERNPEFLIFESNCINYISQCLLAGGIQMNGTKPKQITSTKIKIIPDKWFCYSYEVDPYKPTVYYISSSFSKIKDFIFYWSKIAHVPCRTIENTSDNLEELKTNIKVGDVLILQGKEQHSAIVVKIDDSGIYYNSNTNNRNGYPLSAISPDEYNTITYFNFVDNSK